MFDIEFSETAEKQLYKLEKQTQIRIISTLDRIRVRPYPFVKKLVGSPYFRLRVGDYRIILDIKDDKLLIYVVEVGHRRNIYE
ncbi:MAG: type II toxin-antitoxin system RelE/ParE family toxin [Nanoarchaeota archaeon]